MIGWPKRFRKPGSRRRKSRTLPGVSRKALVDDLDHLTSMIVRIRDKRRTGGMCVFGCGRPIQCAFHFITRSKHIVRWDLDNLVGSCHAENYENEYNPSKFISWYIAQNGLEKWEALVAKSRKRANNGAGFSVEDLLKLRRELQEKLSVILVGKNT